jgi:hypothetical protein
MKVIPSNFVSKNVIAVNVYMDDSFIFFNYEAIFCSLRHFQRTSVPALNRLLCTNVLKFPASTSEHITSCTRKL